jgi:hypothetical protein
MEGQFMLNPGADVRLAILAAIRRAEQSCMVLNAYKVAEHILESLPQADISLEDVVDIMVEMRGTVQAIEFSPPAAVIEVLIEAEPRPAEAGEAIPAHAARMPA